MSSPPETSTKVFRDNCVKRSYPCPRRLFVNPDQISGRSRQRPPSQMLIQFQKTVAVGLILLGLAGLHSPFQLFLRHILDMRGDPPLVAVNILDACGSVSVELVRWLS